MPVMNGIECLETYAQLSLELQRAIVIVMLTTSLLPQDLERVRPLPVASVLNKPLTKEKIQDLLEEYFHSSEPVRWWCPRLALCGAKSRLQGHPGNVSCAGSLHKPPSATTCSPTGICFPTRLLLH
jgi:DNA-binding NarL/FixJ family response regulator